MRLCHNINSPLRVGKTKTIERRAESYNQTGRGVIGDDGDSLTESEDSVQTDNNLDDESEISETSDTTEAGSITEDNADTDAGETTEDSGEACADENWVFERFLSRGDDNGDFNLKQRQKLFRDCYADFLVWYHHLRQNTIHKKIMETVHDLTDGPCDYDKEEALRAAVEQRQFLLNRIVEDKSVHEDHESNDEEITV